jgi:hypothetical protein
MQLYIPSIFIVLLALIVIVGVIPKMSPMIITVLSIVALIYVGYNHYSIFKKEYKKITIGTSLIALAPFLIVGAILFFIFGYILYLIQQNKSPSLPAVEPAPSSQSATNPLTYAVSNVLNMTKSLNTKAPNAKAQSSNQNALLSAIKRV